MQIQSMRKYLDELYKPKQYPTRQIEAILTLWAIIIVIEHALSGTTRIYNFLKIMFY